MSESPVFQPARLGPIDVRNRIIKCGTNEGMSRDGLMTDALIDFHREAAAGGVGMTTLSYCSVASEGRTFKHQLWMRDEALPGLRRFTEAVRAEGAKAAIQLGHAGWFASPHAMKERPVGPSRTFSPHAQTFAREASDADLERLVGKFAEAAKNAVDAGFEGVEVHAGHGYLLSQFLCPWNNRRRDGYGGSLENRARFPRQVMRAVHEAAGGRAAVWAKLNMDDGFEGGLTLDEGVQVARWLEQDGSVDALELTGGHTTKSPFYLMRGDVPVREMIANQKHWMARVGMRLLAKRLLRPWKFEEAFFLDSGAPLPGGPLAAAHPARRPEPAGHHGGRRRRGLRVPGPRARPHPRPRPGGAHAERRAQRGPLQSLQPLHGRDGARRHPLRRAHRLACGFLRRRVRTGEASAKWLALRSWELVRGPARAPL